MAIFTVTESGFPLDPGSHSARFAGLKEYTRDEPSKFGGSNQYFKLHFTPTAAEQAGLDVFVATSTVFSTKSKLFQFAKQMNGGSLKAGDQFDVETLIGKPFLLTVGPKSDGDGNTILGISPVPV